MLRSNTGQISIHLSSPLSFLDYYRKIEFDEVEVAKVRRSMRELLIIEDESHILRLDDRKSIAIYLVLWLDETRGWLATCRGSGRRYQW